MFITKLHLPPSVSTVCNRTRKMGYMVSIGARAMDVDDARQCVRGADYSFGDHFAKSSIVFLGVCLSA